MNQLETFKLLTGCKEDSLALHLIESTIEDILVETNRSIIPTALVNTVVDIAVVKYNRIGMEGDASRSEAGLSISFDSLPDYIRKKVQSFRLGRVCGHAFEQKTNEDNGSQI